MSTITITSKAYPKDIETPNDFPKCKCGGHFELQDIFNKRGIHQLTSAVCSICKEYFCGYSVDDLKTGIPRGQAARDKDGSTYKHGKS